jgi:prefoldin subunit 5
MKKEIEARLKELKEEYQKGQGQIVALEQETANLRNTMLRISGAIQVLQELLGDKESENSIPVNNSLDLAEDSEKRS